ncbi:MAG: hypothetical protein JXR26_11585 [Balneolaceae bacterium]|nr:hypothetical protein [Balneolaceae bacterium]
MSENKTYNTKSDFIEYHENIADHLLPWLKGLPLMLSRFRDKAKNIETNRGKMNTIT